MSAGSKPQTPSQTVGPYFAIGLTSSQYDARFSPLVSNEINGDGESITITGRIFDGEGQAVSDAMIEILQADGAGRLDNKQFLGFARTDTAAEPDNSFVFRTVKPGAVNSGEAPYICVIVFMRGLLLHACTRLYFSDEEEANLNDPVFRQLSENHRNTLVARRMESADHAGYRFDIHMQGARETLFFNP